MSTILITGSGRRLGKALALKFAEIGYDIIVHFNNSEDSALDLMDRIKSIGQKAIAVKADVTSFEEMKSLFEKASKELSSPDILINNAGIFPARKSLGELQLEQWETVINTNLNAYFYTSRLFNDFCSDKGRIINMGSLGGMEIWKERIDYNVSKAGVIQLTKALARDLAPRIAVNCVCPGIIDVPDESPDEVIKISNEKIPMKRYGNIEDLFSAIRFFAETSMYITGQVLSVDGGFHLVK